MPAHPSHRRGDDGPHLHGPASARATAWLRGTLRARIADETQLGLPPVQAPDAIVVLGQVAPRVLPLVFLIVWLALLIAGR